MKKFLMFLYAMILIFGMVGSASAISFLDINGDHSSPDYTPIYMNQITNPSETWYFDLVNDNLDEGDINLGDIINSVFLSIDILDEGDISGEKYTLEFADLDLNSTNYYTDVEVDAQTYTLNVEAWVNAYQLNVTISNVHSGVAWAPGDFFVDEIKLFGDYDTDTDTGAPTPAPTAAPVPEPSTILLMGTGLLGLVGYSRKRLGKKS